MSAEWCSWEDEGVMEFLSDDPTYVAGTLAVLAGIFGIALRVTQQGKYLIAAVAALSIDRRDGPTTGFAQRPLQAPDDEELVLVARRGCVGQ